MGQTQTDKGMIRREFLGWLCKISGGTAAMTLGGGLLPLRKINTVMLSEARAADCNEDTCATSDSGGACTTRDVCDADLSLECTNDECVSDSSGVCTDDKCRSDSSGDCTTDKCGTDSSKSCKSDSCTSDGSGEGDGDECLADSSGDCTSDACVSDKSGECGKDRCVSDSSGDCTADSCRSDSSGGCKSDTCRSDPSGDCTTDKCGTDSSKSCKSDSCISDGSGEGDGDDCGVDSSGECTSDSCLIDKSGACFTSDVCVRDASNDCTSDLCRDDRSGSCATDTCGLDLASNRKTSRREFARSGLNQALKMLYKLAVVILFIGVFAGPSRADINAAYAAFSPAADFVTEGTVNVSDPVGPFLRDCDDDGILEVDVNGDGQCAGDPELRDYNSDGNLELPEGTEFSGSFQFTCFHVPDNAVIIATGPLTISVSDEFAVFGSVRLPDGGTFSSLADIDLHTSAWLAESGGISFTTATAGAVITEPDPEIDLTDEVPSVDFISICSSSPEPESIPTLNEWGLLLMALLMVISSIVIIRKKAHY